MTPDAKKLALDTLLADYWELAKKERMGKTPEITEKLDRLQAAIRELKNEKGKSKPAGKPGR